MIQNYQKRIAPVYTAAEGRDMRVLTAAEFAGKKVEMLEALRRELYEKCGDVGTSLKRRGRSS